MNTITEASELSQMSGKNGSYFASFKGINKLFLFTVVAPTLLSVIYFGLIASDVYISESRFMVHSPNKKSNSPISSLLQGAQGAGFERSPEDAYAVQEFILSRDALRSLDEELGIRKAFASKNVDIFSRFAGLDWDDSFEALHRYYQKKVGIQLDPLSSILTLVVSGFTAEDAYHINQQLLEMGEALINQLNERGRHDILNFAEEEVRNAEKKAKAAALALSAFRIQKGVMDPEGQSSVHLEHILKLQDELTSTETLLAQLKAFAKNNPQIPSLNLRAQTLQDEINKETKHVVGGKRSLADIATEYQRLTLDRQFGEQQLTSALASLEQARVEVMRKQLYLDRITQPSKPDIAIEPRRVKGILATFVLGSIAWGVLSLLVAGVKEHQD